MSCPANCDLYQMYMAKLDIEDRERERDSWPTEIRRDSFAIWLKQYHYSKGESE